MGNRKPGDGMSSMQLGGAMTLEQMNLDRKEEFTGDEYDPFNMQAKQSVDLSLQASNHYMVKENTIGGKLWTPEMQKAQEEANKKHIVQQQNVAANLDDLEDLEEVGDNVAHYNPGPSGGLQYPSQTQQQHMSHNRHIVSYDGQPQDSLNAEAVDPATVQQRNRQKMMAEARFEDDIQEIQTIEVVGDQSMPP